MKSFSTVILTTAALGLVPLQLVFSVFLLLRGHDEPGGGFIGGLVAATAFVLYTFAYGPKATIKLLRVNPKDILAVGCLISLGSITPSIIKGEPILTSQWWEIPLLGGGYVKLSSPLIFDIGVFLTVLGTLMIFVLNLMAAEKE